MSNHKKGLPLQQCRICKKVYRFAEWITITDEYLKKASEYGIISTVCERCGVGAESMYAGGHNAKS